MKTAPRFSQYRVARSVHSLLRRAAPAVLAGMLPQIAYAQEKTIAFSIDSQPLSSALLDFGRQADLSVLAPTLLVSGKIAPDVRGQLSVAAALDRLLEGSGLTYAFVQSNAVRIMAQEEAALAPEVQPASQLSEGGDRVVVTGTNIRGAAPGSSPVDVYTSADIRRSGATTTEQFVAKIPQNLGTMSQYGPGARSGNTNNNAVTAIDLRGLGVGTTLTLLNGHRMALSNSGQSADVSFIPLGAVERVEVLTDGASAIYGSDAIGGVVNFILRDEYEGSESRVSTGAVSQGGMRQGGAGHTTGIRWQGGNGLLSYDYHSASALMTADRSYAIAAGPGQLTPTDIRHNVFATASQHLTEQLTLEADLGASWRKVKNSHANLQSSAPTAHTLQRYTSQSDLVFGNIELDYAFGEDVAASLTASYSELDTDGDVSLTRFNLAPPVTTYTTFDSRNSQFDVTGKLDGVLLEMPGGKVRYSLGAGVLAEEYQGVNPRTALQASGTLGRRSTYGFVEVNVPVIGRGQGVPFMDELTVNLAARYTRYDDTSEPGLDRDFGDSVDPKVGILWSPAPALSFRATYGSSFRAPALTQLDPAGGSHFLFPLPVAGNPAIVIGMTGYAVRDLGPETADSYTLGFDFRTPAPGGFELSATYYNIDYTDRIGEAPNGGLDPFATPDRLPDIVYRPPSAAFIEEALRATPLLVNLSGVDLTDPAAGAAALFARSDIWMYDLRLRNLAISQQHGIDLSVRQGVDVGWGDLQFGANISHILNYEQQGSPSAGILPAFDIPGQPADTRGRAFVGLTTGDFNGMLSVNYTDDYANPLAAAGQRQVESWTTIDLSLGYAFDKLPWGTGTRVGLSIQNLLDEDPPFLRPGTGSNIVYPIGFDPTNANPLGRFVMLNLTQAW